MPYVCSTKFAPSVKSCYPFYHSYGGFPTKFALICKLAISLAKNDVIVILVVFWWKRHYLIFCHTEIVDKIFTFTYNDMQTIHHYNVLFKLKMLIKILKEPIGFLLVAFPTNQICIWLNFFIAFLTLGNKIDKGCVHIAISC